MRFQVLMADGYVEEYRDLAELRRDMWGSADPEYYEEVLAWAKDPNQTEPFTISGDLWEKVQ